MVTRIKDYEPVPDTYDDEPVENDYKLVSNTYDDEHIPDIYDDEPVRDNPIYLLEEMKETLLIEELRKKGIRYVKFNHKESK